MEDYKIRMIKEYRELKDRYEKLHKMIVKYDAGTLEFTPKCDIYMLRDQAETMGHYLNILEIRSEIEGIGYDKLRGESFSEKENEYIMELLKSSEESLIDLEHWKDQDIMTVEEIQDEKELINSIKNKMKNV